MVVKEDFDTERDKFGRIVKKIDSGLPEMVSKNDKQSSSGEKWNDKNFLGEQIEL